MAQMVGTLPGKQAVSSPWPVKMGKTVPAGLESYACQRTIKSAPVHAGGDAATVAESSLG